MTHRRCPHLVVVVASAALVLASCSSGSSGSSSTTRSSTTNGSATTIARTGSTTAAGGSSTTAAPNSSSTTAATSTTTTPGKTGGCTSGSAQIPAGAARRQVIDVDGDGRPDTSWIDTAYGITTVGIATAAGGGAQVPYTSASPISRSVLVVNADEQGPAEIIVSDGRGASLYAFASCSIQPVRNPQGQTYAFDLGNRRDNGTGVGCIQTDKGRRLAGLQAKDRTAIAVSWTSTVINLDGLSATNGAKASGTYALPAEQAKADLLDQITCGDRTMAADGVTEQG
jgi:hypothetical protein